MSHPRCKQTRLPCIPLSVLLTSSSIALITYIASHHLIGISLVIGAISLLFCQPEIRRLTKGWNHCSHQRSLLLQGGLCVVLVTLFLLDMTAVPAQAQFMKGAEDFFNDFAQQANVDSTVTRIIFSTLRGLFLLYLGISLIRVVQAARNDEDWQTLARTPLIVVVTVVVADVLTGLVIGRT